MLGEGESTTYVYILGLMWPWHHSGNDSTIKVFSYCKTSCSTQCFKQRIQTALTEWVRKEYEVKQERCAYDFFS